MIRVHRFVYRALWIVVTAIGALMLLAPALVALGEFLGWSESNGDAVSFWINAGVTGIAGFALLVIGLRRLLRPLKPPANPAPVFD